MKRRKAKVTETKDFDDLLRIELFKMICLTLDPQEKKWIRRFKKSFKQCGRGLNGAHKQFFEEQRQEIANKAALYVVMCYKEHIEIMYEDLNRRLHEEI